jgi:hypothetical protein
MTAPRRRGPATTLEEFNKELPTKITAAYTVALAREAEAERLQGN